MAQPLSIFLVIPLLLGLMYSLSALAFKRALSEGADILHTVFFSNLTTAVLALPVWAAAGGAPPPALYPIAVPTGVLFFLGILLNLLAIRKGDVSVATPLMGTKVIFVAAFTVLFFSQPVMPSLWVCAAIVALALALLREPRAVATGKFGVTVVLALGASAAFALSDVIFQMWSLKLDSARFIPAVLVVVFMLSCGLWPFFPKRAAPYSRAARGWLVAGCLLHGLQAMGMLTCISLLPHPNAATAVNIIYNSRGVWSVILVWWLGHWFGNIERGQGKAVMVRRLLGATLLLAAIVITLGGR